MMETRGVNVRTAVSLAMKNFPTSLEEPGRLLNNVNPVPGSVQELEHNHIPWITTSVKLLDNVSPRSANPSRHVLLKNSN